MRRTVTARARLSDKEAKALQALTRLEGRTNTSETLRELIRAEAVRRGVWDVEEEAEVAKD